MFVVCYYVRIFVHFNSSKQGKGSLGLQDEPNWRHQQSMLAQQAAQGRHQASYAGYQTESASSSSRPGGLNIVRHVPEGSLQGRPHPMHLLGLKKNFPKKIFG